MANTVVKSRRFEGRLDPESDKLISAAAAIVGESRSAFMVDSARERAERILARADTTLMPQAQFDALLESLDEPQSLPVLAKVAAQPRVYRRP
jgi:uncharacterized protein (DUF1778 family)